MLANNPTADILTFVNVRRTHLLSCVIVGTHQSPSRGRGGGDFAARGEGDKMESECKMRIIVTINGEISKEKRKKIIKTLKGNLKNYSFLEVPVEAEVVG